MAGRSLVQGPVEKSKKNNLPNLRSIKPNKRSPFHFQFSNPGLDEGGPVFGNHLATATESIAWHGIANSICLESTNAGG